MGYWNPNGWHSNPKTSDGILNYDFKCNLLVGFNFDVFCISETHLTSNCDLQVDGYTWFGRNRKNKHVKARKGSGGVGAFIKTDILKDYDIKPAVTDMDGIMWLEFSPKNVSGECTGFSICVAYCPPVNSPHCTSNLFFEELYNLICEKQLHGPFIIGGDLNARIGYDADYIEGTDPVPPRISEDDKTNSLGEAFMDMLIRSNCVVLNGRAPGDNSGFTRIGTTGTSIVDYVIIPEEQLWMCDKMNIVSMPDVCTRLKTEPCPTMSDHSVLEVNWAVEVKKGNCSDGGKPVTIKKYNYSSVPEDFMLDPNVKNQVLDAIASLENANQIMDNFNMAYQQLTSIIKDEMDKKLPKITVKLNGNGKRVGNRTSKPWWCDDLSLKWNLYRKAEEAWKSCTTSAKQRLKHKYISLRKDFDRKYQYCRRKFVQGEQIKLVQNFKIDPKNFWRKIDRVGTGIERRSQIGQSVRLSDGSITNDSDLVLAKWCDDFNKLLNNQVGANYDEQFLEHAKDYNRRSSMTKMDTTDILSTDITHEEVTKCILRAKLNKAPGIDCIPSELLKNDTLISALTRLYQYCFTHGIIPKDWKQNIINPIGKGASTDPLDPTSHRGLHLICAICKIYCDIINTRLTDWYEEQGKLSEEQAGFRRGRGCIDQLYTLTSLAKSAIDSGKELYVCYIDARKAFDNVDHNLLWYRLHSMGIHGKILDSIKALYEELQCTVRIGSRLGPWFPATRGVKQGCLISPSLFNLFIDSLITHLSTVDAGVEINGTRLRCLLYADDLVLLSTDAAGLQRLLNSLHEWCCKWRLAINAEKSAVMVFRKAGTSIKDLVFKCGDLSLNTKESYRYLGITLNYSLNWRKTTDILAKSANRALGMLMNKSRLFGGFDYKSYTTIYNATVRPILEYGAEIWGGYESKSINNVHLKACRFYMKLPKHAPTDAVLGDMGWDTPAARQQGAVGRWWHKLCNADDGRLIKTLFEYEIDVLNNDNRANNWVSTTRAMFTYIDLNHFCVVNNMHGKSAKLISRMVIESYMSKFKHTWLRKINDDTGRAGGRKNKLRTYRLFKLEYGPEHYLIHRLPTQDRRAFALFRTGIAPIKIETGRYTRGHYVPVDDRCCNHCGQGTVEDELHVILNCPYYKDLRIDVLKSANVILPGFTELCQADQFRMLMSCPDLIYKTARLCRAILVRYTDSFYDKKV